MTHVFVSSLCGALVLSLAANPSPTESPRGEVEASVRSFLTAFENLDWERFRSFFADDVTAFFPTPEPPQRFDGRAAVEAQFAKVFEAIRARGPGPPYHRLQPESLDVRVLDPSLALVTFELHNAERIARRSLLLRRSGDGWRIVHLHASNTPVAR